MQKTVIIWLPFLIIATLVCGLVYIAVQQDLRQSANDPQIQIAEDVADTISRNGLPKNLFGSTTIDMEKSLATYAIVYDDNGAPIGSSVLLNNKVPVPPAGVFDYVRNHGEDRFTWEPQEGVRSAVVVEKLSGANSGFLLVGRSLREVEKREANLTLEVECVWIASLIFTLLASYYISQKLFLL